MPMPARCTDRKTWRHVVAARVAFVVGLLSCWLLRLRLFAPLPLATRLGCVRIGSECRTSTSPLTLGARGRRPRRQLETENVDPYEDLVEAEGDIASIMTRLDHLERRATGHNQAHTRLRRVELAEAIFDALDDRSSGRLASEDSTLVAYHFATISRRHARSAGPWIATEDVCVNKVMVDRQPYVASASCAAHHDTMLRPLPRICVQGSRTRWRGRRSGLASKPVEDWKAEFKCLCEDLRLQAADGLDLNQFIMLLDDDASEGGCYCTDDELQSIYNRLMVSASGRSLGTDVE